MLALKSRYEQFAWIQILLGRNWLAQIEKSLSFAIPTRQPFSLVILNKDNILGLASLTPKNRKGTCWQISPPQLIDDFSNNSREIILQTFSSAIKLEETRANSWIIKCNVSDLDQIAAARELGFQPLKIYNSWVYKNKTKNDKNNQLILPDGLEWQQIQGSNAQLLWPLEKAGQSPLLRNILDRNWLDILDQKNRLCGMLINNSNKKDIAILGIINELTIENEKIFKILKDTSWDSRFDNLIISLLDRINNVFHDASFEVSSDDIQLNKFLAENNMKIENEKLLLGKSLWKRQSNKIFNKGAKSIESMIEGLQPQSPPLPTPTQGNI